MTVSDVIFWITPWEPSLLFPVALAVMAALYLRGRPTTDEPRSRQLFYWAGLALLYLVSLTGFEYFAEHLFFVHRLQHVVLHHLAPLLIVLARPGERFGKYLPKFRMPFLEMVNGPVFAPILFTFLTFFWLIPAIQQAAMLNLWLYKSMEIALLVNGLMFWQACLSGAPPIPVRMMMAAAIIPGQIGAGLLLVFASHDLYPIFALCGRAMSVTPQADQAIGGAILWLSGAMMSLPVMAILARSLVRCAPTPAIES